jgi:hypothetical protein
MGPCIRNGVGPDAADGTRNALQYPNVNVSDVREIAPQSPERNALRSQAKATILWRPSDGTHSRPITRKRLCSFSDDPRQPTWGHALEMVSARMPLTTRKMRCNTRKSPYQTFERSRLNRLKKQARDTPRSQAKGTILRRPSDRTPSRPIIRQDFALTRTIRIDRHGAMHPKWCRPGCR